MTAATGNTGYHVVVVAAGQRRMIPILAIG
jgi:hypothetical protein